MKYISLFAGIGGFDLALNKLGHQCVYANEWDKYSAQIYEKNFGKRPDTRDITTVQTGEIPEHDLLVGGFPCQAFSIAGKRKGFDETRGTLFFDVARILKDKRPRYFLLENVKGLLNHKSGKTFQTILGVLTDLGYECQWEVLNSKDFGVPQNRERIYIAGNLREEPRIQIFPFTRGYSKLIGETNKQGYANTLTGRSASGHNRRGNYIMRLDVKTEHYQDRIYSPDGISPTLPTGTGGNHQPKIAQNGMKIRRLTPIECERLQGFPDNWTQGVSDTQRYKQLGNAVTVNVIYEIAKKYENS